MDDPIELARFARDCTPIEWFERTGHCGECGQPGDFCLCTPARPCECRDLHPMGSGVGADAAEVFGAGDALRQAGLF